MFYLGGNAGMPNIEVHDVQFAAARQAMDTQPGMRKTWFGDPDKVHIDGCARTVWVDRLSTTLPEHFRLQQAIPMKRMGVQDVSFRRR